MIDASLTTLPDNELIQGYRDGNAACFEVLLARYQAKVYGYIFSVVKDKDVADDIFQDTFFKVVATINGGAYKDENKFIHWVMRIAHNLIVDYFRRNSKMPIVPNRPDYDVVDTLQLHDDNVEQSIMRQQTSSNIRKLVTPLRQVRFQGYSGAHRREHQHGFGPYALCYYQSEAPGRGA